MLPYLLLVGLYLVWPKYHKKYLFYIFSFQGLPSLGDYSSKHGIYWDPKMNFFVAISVTEIEKSDQIKVLKIYIFIVPDYESATGKFNSYMMLL